MPKCSICREEGHNKRKCPNINRNDIQNNTDNTEDNIPNDIKYVTIDEKAKELEISMIHTKFQLLNAESNGNLNLWYDKQEELTYKIIEYLLINNNKIWIGIHAEPGGGKTNLTHCLYYNLKTHPNSLQMGDRITYFTGMSSKSWEEQAKNNLVLFQFNRDSREGDNIFTRDTFYKRIDYLLEHPHLLSNHIFIIDEAQFANEKHNTLAKQLKRLKLTRDKLIELNIKFIFISATMSHLCLELDTTDLKNGYKLEESDLVELVLEVGDNYCGVKYFTNKKMIRDFNNKKKITEQITDILKEKDWINDPKHHILRVKDEKERNELYNYCYDNNYIRYDQDSKTTEGQKDSVKIFQDKLNQKPDKHTFYFIKEFFRASIRLNLNENIGIIFEKPAKEKDDTVTNNGLIPRFFTHYKLSDSEKFDCVMLGRKESFDTYIEYIDNGFKFMDGYQDRNLKNKGEGANKIKKNKKNNTLATNMVNGIYNNEEEDINNVSYKVCDNIDSAISFANNLSLRSTPFTKKSFEGKINDEGFYTQTYCQEKNIVLSVKKFTSEKRAINKTKKIRGRICYENINDNQTLKYVVQYLNNPNN